MPNLPEGAAPAAAPDAAEPAPASSFRKKKMITMRIDQDVLDWLKSRGRGYQTHANDLLRKAVAQEREISG